MSGRTITVNEARKMLADARATGHTPHGCLEDLVATVEALSDAVADHDMGTTDRFGARTQDGTDPRCVVEAGTDSVTYCARMAWMLDAGDRHFRVGYRVPRNAEAYGAVVIDVKGGRFSFCDYCPFCGAYIATRKPGGAR